MKYISIKDTPMKVSSVAAGCMRIADKSVTEVTAFIDACMENEINFYDHADIYGGGTCESLFGQALKETKIDRETIYLQSKCGIRPGFYDFSKEHIIQSVDTALKRLQVEYLDTYLLHRPDTLMEPEEVSEAFEELKKSGKVRHFGVSNHNAAQISLLQSGCQEKLKINQLQFGPAHAYLVANGMAVNMAHAQSVDRVEGTLEYCRENHILMQTWSPFQKGMFGGVFMGDYDNYGELNQVVTALAKEKNVPVSAIVIAWILRHPANMQVILGTTNKTHMKEACMGCDVELSRQEWYQIFQAAGNILP